MFVKRRNIQSCPTQVVFNGRIRNLIGDQFGDVQFSAKCGRMQWSPSGLIDGLHIGTSFQEPFHQWRIANLNRALQESNAPDGKASFDHVDIAATVDELQDHGGFSSAYGGPDWMLRLCAVFFDPLAVIRTKLLENLDNARLTPGDGEFNKTSSRVVSNFVRKTVL